VLYALALKIMCMINSAKGLADFVEIYPNVFHITNMKEFAVSMKILKR